MAVHIAGDARSDTAGRRGRLPVKTKGKRRRSGRRGTAGGSVYDTVATEIAVLEREITATERKLCVARDEVDRERSCLLLGLLATEQRQFEKKTRQLSSVFREAGPALDEALLKLGGVVLAAQRLKSGVD